MNPLGWTDENAEHVQLQADLSCLIDGELHEVEAARVLAELESNPEAAEFFESIRMQIAMHQKLAQPDGLADEYSALTGSFARDLETRQLVHRLASIFYQVGKAYTLAAIDANWRQRVFEKAVAIDAARGQGRGFIDGVAARQAQDSSSTRFGGIEWRNKRHLLNGALERVEDPRKKARRLLEECLEIESDYEHAHLYLGFLDLHDGKLLRAVKRFERVFREGVDEASRGHAAMQLGKLHAKEGEYREALRWFRWVGLSGLGRQDPRFFPAGFNVGLCYANLERPQRAADAFREMLDTHPERALELAGFFAGSPALRNAIDRQSGFPELLLERCPELFQPSASTGSAAESQANEDADQ